MGKLLCPKTNFKNNFQANSPKSRKLVQAPGPSLWPSLFLLVGSLFPLGEVFTKPLAIMPSVIRFKVIPFYDLCHLLQVNHFKTDNLRTEA